MEENIKTYTPDVSTGVEGKYKVQLFDSNTDEKVFETEWHNLVNPNLGLFGYQPIYQGGVLANTYSFDASFELYHDSSYISGLGTVLSLWNTTDTPENRKTEMPRGEMVSSTNIFKSSSTELNISGNVNLNESFNRVEIDSSGRAIYRRHLVVDYATNQGNGTFNSMVIGSSPYSNFVRSIYSVYSGNDTNQFTSNSIGKRPRFLINVDTIGKSVTGTSDSVSECGAVSVESPGIMWVAGTQMTSVLSNGNHNNYFNEELRMYRFNITDGGLVHTKTVTLSGTPDEIIQGSKTQNFYMNAVYFKGKFYAACNYSGGHTNWSSKTLVYNEDGAYESTIDWPASNSDTDCGTGSVMSSVSSFTAIPECVCEFRYNSSRTKSYLTFYGSGGSILKQYTPNQLAQMLYDLGKDWFSSLDKNSIRLQDARFIPITTSENKNYIAICLYGNLNSLIGYYDPVKNEVFSDIQKVKHFRCTASGTDMNCYYGAYVYKNMMYQFTTKGIEMWGEMPWLSWCKLPSSVTKTSSTTMKIQYDITSEIVGPFSTRLTTI